MPYRSFIMALCASGGLLLPMLAAGDPEAVDLADSLDFERFHAGDTWAIGIGQDGLMAKRTVPGEDAADTSAPAPEAAPAAPARRVARNEVRQHRISNPYSVQRGRNRPSAVDATESLFRSMAETCPEGWQKDREWTTPTEEGFLLHFEFHCLENPG